MSVRYLCSFDGFAAIAEFGHEGGFDVTTAPGVVLDEDGSTGQCIRANDANCYISRWSGGGDEVFIGFKYRPPSVGAGGAPFLTLLDSDSGEVVTLSRDEDKVVVSGALSGESPAGVLVADEWHQIELHVELDAAGAVEVRVNLVTVANLSGDTNPGDATELGDYRLLGDGTTSEVNGCIDDLWVLDDTGSVNNTFWGDTSLQVLRPTAEGETSQWVGSDSDSDDNWALIDEDSTNDGDYVQAAADGEKDTHVFADPEGSPTQTVRAVQVTARAAYLDAGTPKALALIARTGAGVEEDSDDLELTNSLADYSAVFETKPGGGAWSFEDIDAAEFGYKQRPA